MDFFWKKLDKKKQKIHFSLLIRLSISRSTSKERIHIEFAQASMSFTVGEVFNSGSVTFASLQVLRWFPHKPHANRVCKNGHTRLKHLKTKRYKTPQEKPQKSVKTPWSLRLWAGQFIPSVALGNGHNALPALAQGTQLGLRFFHGGPRWTDTKMFSSLSNLAPSKIHEMFEKSTLSNEWNVSFLISNVSGRNRIEIDLGFKFFLHVLQPKNRSTCIGQHELQTTLNWLITVRKNTYRRTIQRDAIAQTKLDRRLDAASAKTSRVSSPKRSSNERGPLSPLQEEQRKKQRADSIKKHDGHLQLHTTLFYFMPARTNLGSGWFPEHSLPVLGPAPPFARLLSRAPAIPALRAQTNHARDSTTTPRWAEQNAVTQGNATTNAHNANANQCLYSAFPEVHILARRPWQNHRHRLLNLAATILSALIVSNSCTG